MKKNIKTIKKDNNSKSKIYSFDHIRDVVFIVASFFAIIAFIRTCNNEKHLKEVNYKLTSLDYQPKLKITDVNSSIKIESLNVKAIEEIFEHSGDKEDPYSFKVDLVFLANINVRIENVGDSAIGKIKSLLTTDQSVDFKKLAMGKIDKPNMQIDFKEWPELTNLQILPGDATILNTELLIKYIKNQQFVMHIIIVYENDFGNIYHTHTRIPINIKSPYLINKKEAKLDQIEEELKKYILNGLVNKELISIDPPISTYTIYNEKESKQVKEFLQNLGK